MCIFLVSDNQEIEEENTNISTVGAGQNVSLTFCTLVILYPIGVSYPGPSGLGKHAYR